MKMLSIDYQQRIANWMLACFGSDVTKDGVERNHRFLEEALELVQSLGCTASEAHQLVDYVFGRDVGEPGQEVGGVMVTLAALCNVHGLLIGEEAEREHDRIWTKVEAIRAKHAGKPKHSPLPGPSVAETYVRIRNDVINSPETADFMAGVPIEAAHQRDRWGADHGGGKEPEDWIFLVGWLLGKASVAARAGDSEKARHHTISSAAALANWHAALSGRDTRMRPGISKPDAA